MTHNQDAMPEPIERGDLFVAFANTLELERGEPVDAIPDVDALLTWLRQNALLSERGRAAEVGRLHRDAAEAERRLTRFRRLRDLIAAIADRTNEGRAPTTTQIRELNHILRHGVHYHQLRLDSDRTRYTFAQIGDRLDQARATIAGGVARFLAEEGTGRLRTCANEGCRYLFIDRSPTGRRRWCDMRTCGNQAKVARHRAKARREGEPAPREAAPGPPGAAGSTEERLPSAPAQG
jgi:predicted RNA-binding Zn ribbon-like protein